jgi:hypothetical protein
MRLEVLIPVARPTIQRALQSLSCQTEPPDLVTLIGNAPQLLDLDPCGLPVRILRHTSRVYCYGIRDIVLGRNVGVWWAQEPWVLCFDDDQVAPATLIADVRTRLLTHPYVYGHYRYLDFAELSLSDLMALPPTAGRTREFPPNAWHLYYSGYTGLFACNSDLLRSVGWDMIYNGSGAIGEDQNLAYRLTRALGAEGKLFVHEPPYIWHPEKREPFFATVVTNGCTPGTEGHALGEERERFGVRWQSCTRCPYFRITHHTDPGRPMVIWPFDPRAVKVEDIRL